MLKSVAVVRILPTGYTCNGKKIDCLRCLLLGGRGGRFGIPQDNFFAGGTVIFTGGTCPPHPSPTSHIEQCPVEYASFFFHWPVSSVVPHLAIGGRDRGFDSYRPVKSDAVSSTARLRCNVSSELCCPGAKPRRWAPPLVVRFGEISSVQCFDFSCIIS